MPTMTAFSPMTRRTTPAAAIALAAAPAFAAENPMVGGAAMYDSKNIVENAVNSADHTTLVAAVKAAGLVETLKGKGPFTVFAPTDAAFAALPAGTVEDLLRILDQKQSPEEVLVSARPRMIPVYNTTAENVATAVRQVYQDRLVSAAGQNRQPNPEEFMRALRGGRGGGGVGGGGGSRGGGGGVFRRRFISEILPPRSYFIN